MTKLLAVSAAALIIGMAAPASAQAFNDAGKIVRGDFASAEHELVAQRALYPNDVDLMLNLAAVYAHTGREAQARELYRNVAVRPDEEIVLASTRATWSRTLAAEGMARLGTAVATR